LRIGKDWSPLDEPGRVINFGVTRAETPHCCFFAAVLRTALLGNASTGSAGVGRGAADGLSAAGIKGCGI